MSYKYKFYIILLGEFILLPALYFNQWLKKKNLNRENRRVEQKNRLCVLSNKIYVSVHEWGGYPLRRSKTIKNGVTFDCGLDYQLERFKTYKDIGRVELTVTMSDKDRHSDLNKVKGQVDKFISVSNHGMDFSGYAAFYESIKDKPNGYVILTNSSVHFSQDDFLERYIEYMEENKDVGMLGVSYCTKRIQSLVRNNFTPHIQSFFILTTIDVLREIVAINKGKFPGEGVDHKLMLIREGEIMMSLLCQRLGYSLAVVLPDGNVFKFGNYTVYKDWSIIKGDIRQHINEPNKINKIK